MIIKGKTIILTGASRVGKSVARSLASKGANLAVSYLRGKEGAEEICEEAKRSGSRAIAVRADLGKKDDIAAFLLAAKEAFGHVDGLVHMAANYEKTRWENLTEEAWDRDMNIIARSAFLLGKMTGDEMLKNEGEEIVVEGASARIKGKIITISDWSVLTRPYKDYLPYNVAKAAVIALTKSLAKELAPHILVNSVAPGPIMRPPDLSNEENREALAGTPLLRWGGADEIAKAVLYLLDADFVTGQILAVDGGRTVG